jgi:hypothetical protein
MTPCGQIRRTRHETPDPRGPCRRARSWRAPRGQRRRCRVTRYRPGGAATGRLRSRGSRPQVRKARSLAEHTVAGIPGRPVHPRRRKGYEFSNEALTAEEAGQVLPDVKFVFNRSGTALVVIDPQNDFLSPDGAGWPVFGRSVTENKVVAHRGRSRWRRDGRATARRRRRIPCGSDELQLPRPRRLDDRTGSRASSWRRLTPRRAKGGDGRLGALHKTRDRFGRRDPEGERLLEVEVYVVGVVALGQSGQAPATYARYGPCGMATGRWGQAAWSRSVCPGSHLVRRVLVSANGVGGGDDHFDMAWLLRVVGAAHGMTCDTRRYARKSTGRPGPHGAAQNRALCGLAGVMIMEHRCGAGDRHPAIVGRAGRTHADDLLSVYRLAP